MVKSSKSVSPPDSLWTAAHISKLEARIVENKSQLNDLLLLVDALGQVSISEEGPLVPLIHANFRVFQTLLFESGRVQSVKKDTTQNQVRKWIRGNWCNVVEKLIEYLDEAVDVPRVQMAAFNALMDFVKLESTDGFASELFLRIVREVLQLSAAPNTVLDAFRLFHLDKYDDVRLHFHRLLPKLVAEHLPNHGRQASAALLDDGAKKSKRKRELETPTPTAIDPKTSAIFLRNLYTLMTGMKTAVSFEDPAFFVPHLGEKLVEQQTLEKTYAKAFSESWLAFLRLPLNMPMYKGVLSILEERVMPQMHDPRRLHDFLTDSYNAGGAISLLALHGLFTLIHKHNLDYPDFYRKLYALFDNNMLHLKYRSRFLTLSDLFLKSTHLPSYLVAAFVKRMARLALFAPPAAVISVLPMIHNLLQRHPSCLVLLHRELDQQQEQPNLVAQDQPLRSDPYIFEESDPAKCNALESSLWELEALKEHYYGFIATFVRGLRKPIDNKKMPYTVQEFLEYSYATMMEEELTRPLKQTPVISHQKVQSVFTGLECFGKDK